jgi:hypothetical protein
MEDTYEKAWLDTEPKVEAPAVTKDEPMAEPSAEAKAMATGASAARDADASEFSKAFHGDAPAAKPATFKEAFAAARAKNIEDGTNAPFEFNGKKFTTALKSDIKAKAKAAVAPRAASKSPAAPAVADTPKGMLAELAATADKGIAADGAKDKIQLPHEASRPGMRERMRAEDAKITGVRDADGNVMGAPKPTADISKVGSVRMAAR